MEDLNHDPDLLFRVGLLVGAATQHSHFCSMQEDKEVKSMGERLEGVIAWFFEDAKRNTKSTVPVD